MRPSIAVFGSANVDFVTTTARLPQPGETLVGHTFEQYPGGKGANQAVAAARLGADVSFYGSVGRDWMGDMLMAALRREGVDVSAVAVTEKCSTGTATILVTDDGQNAITCVPGANACADPAYVETVLPRIIGADVLLLQLEVPIAAIATLLQSLGPSRPLVVLDPSPAQVLAPLPLARVDFLTPNELELVSLTGEVDPERASRNLFAQGAMQIVYKAGGQGAYLFSRRQCVHVPASPTIVKDATAAGDAFNAALAIAIAEERTLVGALKWANAAGSLAASRRGAQPSLPTRNEVENLLRERGI